MPEATRWTPRRGRAGARVLSVLVAGTLAVLLVLSIRGDAVAQGVPPPSPGLRFSVSPPRTDLTLSPGDEKSASASIANLSDGAYNITIAVMDFAVVDVIGTVALTPANPSNPRGLGAFMRIIGPTTVALQPGTRYVAPVTIRVPPDTPGGTRFGAIVFTGGPPPEPGRVTLTSQLASLVVGRVSGLSVIGGPQGGTQITLALPIRDTAGKKVVKLQDPVTGLTVTAQANTTVITVPVNDRQGSRQGSLTAQSKEGVIASPDGARVKVDSMRVESFTWEAPLSGQGGQPDRGRVQVAFDLKGVVPQSSVDVFISDVLEPPMRAAIATLATALSTDAPVIAYGVQVQKNNVQDGRDVTNARVVMAVPAAWADRNNADLVRIIRYADDGSLQVLETFLVGVENGFAVFVADSPRGLSGFALAAFKKPVDPVDLPAGTLPSVAAPLVGGAPAHFDIVLSPDIRLSDRAAAADSEGQPVNVVVGKGDLVSQAVAPDIGEITVNLARPEERGRLRWVRVPGVALAGHNKLVLRFDNMGNGDYEVRPGLATVVGMRGKTAVNMQVPGFNAFPGASRDLELDWMTPSGAFGRYTVAARLTFGDPSQSIVSEPVSVWVVPWKWVLSVLLVGLGLFGLAWATAKAVRDYIERQVQSRAGAVTGATPPPAPPGNTRGSPPQETPPPAEEERSDGN